MERIKEALSKVDKFRDPTGDARNDRGFDVIARQLTANSNSQVSDWAVTEVSPDPAVLERQRIVSHNKTEPSHVVYDVLRTKIFQALQSHGWKSVAVSSPAAGCGKTNVAINLAFSMARQEGCRTILIDLDLRRPSVERTLDVHSPKPLGHYIEGRSTLDESFVRIGENLFIGLNSYRIRNSAEMMRHQKIRDILPAVLGQLRPDVIIFDLPPLLVSDDAIGFLPQVDCGLIVVEAGRTTAKQIEECEQQFAERSELLGLVLNKCRETAEDFYRYDEF